MEPIIDPISVDILKSELTPARKLRDTNKGGNEIYIVNHHDSPNIMKEIGRLREEAFRDSGGGSGMSMDIDDFDTMENPYQQLIVWDPDADKIIGGYRYILGNDIKMDENGQPLLATAHMFHFSDKFIKEYLPHTLELGRSFVAPEYQSSKAGAKSLFALDNLWDGICAVMMEKPEMKYFFGKMTIYPTYNREARDLILNFLESHYGDPDELVRPYEPIKLTTDQEYLDSIIDKSLTFKESYKLLNTEVRKHGVNIPPLVNAYMGLSPTLKMFGGCVNHELNMIEDYGILISFDDMYEEKKARHLDSYLNEKMGIIKNKFPQFFEDMGDNLRVMILQRRERIQARKAEKLRKRMAKKK